ncbi:MAG: hypothetical protein ABEI99_10350 [Halobaculum sp.]
MAVAADSRGSAEIVAEAIRLLSEDFFRCSFDFCSRADVRTRFVEYLHASLYEDKAYYAQVPRPPDMIEYEEGGASEEQIADKYGLDVYSGRGPGRVYVDHPHPSSQFSRIGLVVLSEEIDERLSVTDSGIQFDDRDIDAVIEFIVPDAAEFPALSRVAAGTASPEAVLGEDGAELTRTLQRLETVPNVDRHLLIPSREDCLYRDTIPVSDREHDFCEAGDAVVEAISSRTTETTITYITPEEKYTLAEGSSAQA